MSEEPFSEEVKFPEDLETMLSMSIQYEKLQSIMRFILDLLKRHEQGLRMAFTKQNVIAPEVLTLHSFKESLESKIFSLDKSLNKTNKNLEELKQNLESRGDTTGALKYILNTLTEHDSAVLSQKKLLNELVALKETNEKRLGVLEENYKKIADEKSTENLAEEKPFHRPEENEKNKGFKAPSRKYKAKHKEKGPEESGDSLKSSCFKIEQTGEVKIQSGTFQLTSPPLHFKELMTRIMNIEKSIESSHGSKEIKDRLGKLESMYKYIEGVVDSCEPLTLKNRDRVLKIARSLKNLENEMTNKLNTQDFDAVKTLVITLASGSNNYDVSSLIPTKEINMIRVLDKKMHDLERNFSDIVKIYPENIEEIALKLRRIEQKLNFKAGEDQIESLQNTLNTLSDKIKTLESPKETSKLPTSKLIDSGLLNSVNRRVAGFEDVIRGLKIPSGLDLSHLWEELKKTSQNLTNLNSAFEELKKWEKEKKAEILQKLNLKVEIESFQFLDQKYKNLIEGLNDKFSAQFADKIDMRKGFRYLESLIKQVRDNNKPEGDDAMFAKKPLEGWSCASCEKKLEKLTGKIPTHSPWRKLPLRDTSERMLKAGPGYSKMLSTLQLESLRTKPDSEEVVFFSGRKIERSVTPNS